MKDVSFALAAPALLAAICCTALPASAISADLAKKCRDMAIERHPPPRHHEHTPYAQAEREFFQTCISRNGQMPKTDVPQ